MNPKGELQYGEDDQVAEVLVIWSAQPVGVFGFEQAGRDGEGDDADGNEEEVVNGLVDADGDDHVDDDEGDCRHDDLGGTQRADPLKKQVDRSNRLKQDGCCISTQFWFDFFEFVAVVFHFAVISIDQFPVAFTWMRSVLPLAMTAPVYGAISLKTR